MSETVDIEKIVTHIRERLAKSGMDSPAIHLSRGAWDAVVGALTARRATPVPQSEAITKAVEALQGMMTHSCVADAGADMKDAADHAAETAALRSIAALTALQEQPAPVGVKVTPEMIRAVHDGPLTANDHELVEGSEQWNWIKSVLETGLSALQPAREEAEDKYQAAKRKVWGGAPVAATDTQLEAEALVKRLREHEEDRQYAGSFWTEVPEVCIDAANFIARHHLGEKS